MRGQWVYCYVDFSLQKLFVEFTIHLMAHLAEEEEASSAQEEEEEAIVSARGSGI